MHQYLNNLKAVGGYAVGAVGSAGGAVLGAASKIPGATTVGKLNQFYFNCF